MSSVLSNCRKYRKYGICRKYPKYPKTCMFHTFSTHAIPFHVLYFCTVLVLCDSIICRDTYRVVRPTCVVYLSIYTHCFCLACRSALSCLALPCLVSQAALHYPKVFVPIHNSFIPPFPVPLLSSAADAMRCAAHQKAHPLFEQLRADLLKSEAVVRVVGQVLLGCARKSRGERRGEGYGCGCTRASVQQY